MMGFRWKKFGCLGFRHADTLLSRSIVSRQSLCCTIFLIDVCLVGVFPIASSFRGVVCRDLLGSDTVCRVVPLLFLVLHGIFLLLVVLLDRVVCCVAIRAIFDCAQRNSMSFDAQTGPVHLISFFILVIGTKLD